MKSNADHVCPECGASEPHWNAAQAFYRAAEIERLKDAKRRALAIADERSKENVALRAALEDAEQTLDLYINGAASIAAAKYTISHIREVLGSNAEQTAPRSSIVDRMQSGDGGDK